MAKHGLASVSYENSSQPHDSSHQIVTNHKLQGHNFLQWNQSVFIYICGRGKDGHLTGDTPAPDAKDPKFRSWKTDDHLVMSWLLNSMTTDVGENFLLFKTAKEIWDAARDTYSSSENSSALLAIETRLYDLRQGDLNVTQYFNLLVRNWQQLDMYETYEWKCGEDMALYKKIVEKKRILRFLLGLNKELDDVRGRIMGSRDLPSLREAFAEVRREESRKHLMMPEIGSSTGPEVSAMLTHSSSQDRQSKKGNRPWCDHCKRVGHVRDTCWKIHGKPADWKPTKKVTEIIMLMLLLLLLHNQQLLLFFRRNNWKCCSK
jgi:hypothetical protein